MRGLAALFTSVLVGLVAAGGVQAQQRGAAHVEARQWSRINDRLELRYTLEIEGEEGEERRPVAVTDGFESGDRFTLRVRPTEDAYLYLFVSDTEGGFTLVAPRLEDDGSLPGPASGGADAQLPASGTSLRLDGNPGVERLYLLASREPLDEVEDLLEYEQRQVGEAWLIDLRDYYARNGTLTRQVRNQAVRLDYRQRGRGAAVVLETIFMRHYLPD